MKCDTCGGGAVYFRRYSGQKFCEEHFTKYFEDKVRRTIKEYKMLNRGEKVGVALSGGKDSTATLFALKELSNKMNLEVHAIAIDEGIKGYREKTLKAAKKSCKDYGVPLYILSFKKNFGKTLDQMEKTKNPCTCCGVFRRKLLNEKARELKLDKLATGHNLDDEVQAIMMNYIRGDLERVIRLEGALEHEKFVKRIKPLLEMPEKEVALYAFLKGLNASFEECPYTTESFRAGIRDFINNLEKNNAGIKFSIFGGYRKMLPYLENYARDELRECEICREPTSQKICKACRLIESF